MKERVEKGRRDGTSSQNKLRVIIITIIVVFLIGLVGLSIRMALQPQTINGEGTEVVSVLQSGFT
ncbi:hypothetical protein GLW00_13250 [Halobacillus litoralis]|uniref:Uncharacterized protein n=1 Tax=Halobacillus litoralis TaxID=45668 RepID=A0A845FE65_9BACI|nr:hypothetical protein [Halobacillus litoralis]MYL71827.1 hypothetical protein [Halobacillus litoralis]